MDHTNFNNYGQSQRQATISTGNDTLDKFLGGGFLQSSLNLFERTGPSSKLLEVVWNRSIAANSIASMSNLIFVDFDTLSNHNEATFLSSLPMPVKVKTELMYKDIRGKSSHTNINIAWRYSNRNSSPSDKTSRMNQIDFGLCLSRETEPDSRGILRLVNIDEDFNLSDFFRTLNSLTKELNSDKKAVNIVIQNLLHPLSPITDSPKELMRFMYLLRCFSRNLISGAILVSYDCSQFDEHQDLKQHLYNIADSVVSFHSYETGQNIESGYKNIDGTMDYLKAPKINSFGLHFQQELSDWGYRFTKNHRFFVVDELSLPPCLDDAKNDRVKNHSAAEVTKLGTASKELEQVGPLEDFREAAEDIISKL